MQETERGHQAVKSAKTAIDESKLTPPQRRVLALAKAQGVSMTRKFEDLTPNLGLTPEEADHFGETLQKIRDESRQIKKI